MKRFFILPLLFLSSTILAAKSSPHLYVVIPSYNNEKYCIGNLESLACQAYTNWEAVYINDNSLDQTGPLVEQFVRKHHLQNKFTIIHNSIRKGALANTYYAIKKADPNDIVIILDGDDQLANPNVLNTIATIYKKNPNVWLTYGNYASSPFSRRSVCREYPARIVRQNAFRKYKYVSGHLRTFYAGLFHQIKKEDLLENGKFLPSAGDVATMLPMLEMAANGHFLFVDQILYIYRDDNPINDFRNRAVQKRCSLLVRSRPPYKPLKRAVWCH
jgi:glycosyltransferase involved in cell wall biosynthesis